MPPVELPDIPKYQLLELSPNKQGKALEVLDEEEWERKRGEAWEKRVDQDYGPQVRTKNCLVLCSWLIVYNLGLLPDCPAHVLLYLNAGKRRRK